MTHYIELKEYPHYELLPAQLKYNLNILRTNVLEGVEGSCQHTYTIDQNDMEFLTLDSLIDWVKETLPEFETNFLEAASRIHTECFEQELFDYFVIEEKDLFSELLYVKDEYELTLAKQKQVC